MDPLSRIVKAQSELVLDLLKNFKTGLSLKEGQMVEAKVLRLLPQGKAQLQVQNQVVDVKTQVPLTENETLYLKVMKSGDSQVLKMVESHKPVMVSPGLAEVRALGREGPYEALAKVLNTPLPGKTSEAPPLLKQDPTGTAPVLPGKEGAPSQAPVAGTSASVPTARTLSAMLRNQPALQAFVDKSPLPQAFKLALVISQNPAEMNQVPLKTVQDLSRSLDMLLNRQAPDPAAAPREDLSLLTRDKTAALELLTRKIQALFNRLDPGDKTLAEQFLANRSLNAEGKMAALLTASPPQAGKDTVLADIKNSLVKAFFPKGFSAGDALPADLKPPMSAPPNVPAGTPNASVFTETRIIQSLRNLISTMALKPQEPFDAENLRNLVKNSGLLWERKLKTVVEARMAGKGTLPMKDQMAALMQKDVKALSMNAHESAKHSVEKTLDTLKHFVDNVEKLQVLNSHTSEDSGRYLLPLPFFSGDKLKFGQLFIDTDKKKEKDSTNTDRIIRVAFMLDMSELGHVEADISVFRKSLSGEFIVGQEDAKARFDEALPGLVSGLARKGYSVSRLECRLEQPEILATRSLADRMVTEGDGAVSIVI